MSNSTSNIDELEKHLRTVFQGMFESTELQNAGKNVYDIMYQNVRSRLSSTGYNYSQSGDFLEAFDSEKKGYGKNITKNSMTVGFADITEGSGLNDPNYMRQEQTVFFFNGRYKDGVPQGTPMTLKAETQMPKWIVLEFGTGAGAEELPPQFDIGYTRRPDKDIMYGPSFGPPAGLNKPVFAMLSGQQVASFRGEDKPTYNNMHKGIRAGKFFQNGLDDSKSAIYAEFGKAISNYLKSTGG